MPAHRAALTIRKQGPPAAGGTIKSGVMSVFELQIRAIDAAAATAEREREALYVRAGERKYADDYHDERMAEIVAAFEKVASNATDVADEKRRAAEAVTDALDVDQPLDRLSDADVERANARALFIREDAESMPIERLAERCRVAAAGGDLVTRFLLERYAARRMNEERGRAPQEEIVMLADGLNALGDTLRDPKAAQKREEAREVGRAAAELMSHIREARKRATGRDAMADRLVASGRYGRL